MSLVFDRLARAEVLAIIHGAARRSLQLKPWAERGAVLVELPGHGQAPMIEAKVEVWAAAFQAALRQLWATQPITLVGESLGGVIALHMEAERRILLDPPWNRPRPWRTRSATAMSRPGSSP
ncbi:alpha/beta fold hydrolase [Phenylobacterium sp.]|uniref:alpha/beta fold hydrolase n=1 Tax=Phenylobacterium sp. TaxID=1871053 RepID=UPI0035C7B6F4